MRGFRLSTGFAVLAVGLAACGSPTLDEMADEPPVPVDSYVVPSRTPPAEKRTPPAEERPLPAEGRLPAKERTLPAEEGLPAKERTPRAEERTPPAEQRTGTAEQRTETAVVTPRRTINAVRAGENEVVRLTNRARERAGCEPLRTDKRLRQAARRHSADMASADYFAHDSQNGRTPWDRMTSAGYTQPAAENIARGQRSARQVVDAWLASPGHRANILNCGIQVIGVGLRYGSGGPWWTQDFGYH